MDSMMVAARAGIAGTLGSIPAAWLAVSVVGLLIGARFNPALRVARAVLLKFAGEPNYRLTVEVTNLAHTLLAGPAHAYY